MITKEQQSVVEQVKLLCSQLSVEDTDFPESSRKYIATLNLNAGWLFGDLIKNDQLTNEETGGKMKRPRGRPRKE